MGTVSLLVAGGNEIARKGLCALFREQFGWKVTAEARDEAVEITGRIHPDIAIMDVDMPLLNGLEATRHIAKQALRTRVLLLVSNETDQMLLQAVQAGAHGCLVASDTAADLLAAVEALRQGKQFFTSKFPQKVLSHNGPAARKTNRDGNLNFRRLTSREREVLQLLAEGNSNKQVGTILKISVKTAETHRSNVMQKIECHSASALVRYAIRNHIIEA